MINHQSPYGQILKFSVEDYYECSDEELKSLEQKYASSNSPIINISKRFETDEIDSYFNNSLDRQELGDIEID